MTLWVVRAGEDLSYLPTFVERSVVAIGWADLPDSLLGMTRSHLAELMAATYPEASPATVSNYTGQVWAFLNSIAIGDLVVVPLQTSREFRVGRVLGPAVTGPVDADLGASRPVEWLTESLSASILAQDLRNSLGAIMTVFRPRLPAAEWRLEQAIQTGTDPGPDVAPKERSGAWVFQANPDRYDLMTAVQSSTEMTWSANQHRDNIEPGDRVWFRLTGPNAGIYASGRVMTRPRPEPSEFGDWSLDVVIEALVEPPLLRSESDHDEVLGHTTALAGRMGTNLALSVEADLRLEDVLADRLIPVGGATPQARLLENRLYLDVARLTTLVEEQLLAELKAIHHDVFEEVCALYLRALGCDDAHVVGASTSGSLGDGGIDVEGTLAQAGLPAVHLQVQAKRVNGSIPPHVVTQLRGSISPGAYGMIITTGYFTRSAIQEASRPDRNTIRLIDGHELAHVLVENGLGVRHTAVTLPRLDVSSLRGRLEAERG